LGGAPAALGVPAARAGGSRGHGAHSGQAVAMPQLNEFGDDVFLKMFSIWIFLVFFLWLWKRASKEQDEERRRFEEATAAKPASHEALSAAASEAIQAAAEAQEALKLAKGRLLPKDVASAGCECAPAPPVGEDLKED